MKDYHFFTWEERKNRIISHHSYLYNPPDLLECYIAIILYRLNIIDNNSCLDVDSKVKLTLYKYAQTAEL